jgi:predicted nucleotidyltransferase
VTASAVARRRAERDALIARARAWAESLGERRPGVVACVVVGSVARGDFNKWSDLDVLVVTQGLPEGWLDRCAQMSPVTPGLQVIAWTPEEYRARRSRRDPIAIEAEEVGVVVWGSLAKIVTR